MPIIKSAKKRVKTAKKAAIRNSKTKRQLKDSMKAFNAAVSGKTAAAATKAYNEAQAALDTAVKKHVIHKNKAAREKARLSAQLKAAGIKQTTTSSAKKPATKKAPAKKSSTAQTSKKKASGGNAKKTAKK